MTGPSISIDRSAGESQPRLHQHGREVQRFDQLRAMPLGLPEDARDEVAALLNQVLADTPDPPRPLQEDPLADAGRDLLPASPADGQARRRSRPSSSTPSPSASRRSARSRSATRATSPS